MVPHVRGAAYGLPMSIFKAHLHERLSVAEYCTDYPEACPSDRWGTLGTVATSLLRSGYLHVELLHRSGKKPCRLYPLHILHAASKAVTSPKEKTPCNTPKTNFARSPRNSFALM